jgi:hypothetical protein
MNHPRIDDDKVVDRYLAGRLPPEDEALFEEHLFECADCLHEVEAGDELRRGLRAVAVEDATRATVSLGLMAWLRSRRPAQLAVLVLAVVLLPAAVVWQQTELGRAREAARRAAAAGARLAEPMSDFLVVSLGVTRDAGRVAEIRLDPGKQAVLLSLELPTVDARHYRVTLHEAAGEILWRGDGLEPNLYDTLLVALPSCFLRPGSYRITVEALPATGGEPAGEMEFRVLP